MSADPEGPLARPLAAVRAEIAGLERDLERLREAEHVLMGAPPDGRFTFTVPRVEWTPGVYGDVLVREAETYEHTIAACPYWPNHHKVRVCSSCGAGNPRVGSFVPPAPETPDGAEEGPDEEGVADAVRPAAPDREPCDVPVPERDLALDEFADALARGVIP